MRFPISVVAVGHASSIFLVVSYLLCISFDLLFPGYAMYTVWQGLLPGFEWLTLRGFLVGLLETWAYGWFFAVIWVPIYNLVDVQTGRPG